MLPKKPDVDLNKPGNCFACGSENPIGLKLRFTWDGTTASAEFTPTELHQGWSGIVHGGLLYTLLDEAMVYVPYFMGVSTITAKGQVRFKQPAQLHKPLDIKATLVSQSRKLLKTQATLSLKDGTVVAEADSVLFVVVKENISCAVIWDMDGVIADTAALHLEAWQKTFEKRGTSLKEEQFRDTFGRRNDAIIQTVMSGRATEKDIELISTEKEAHFRSLITQDFSALPGVKHLIGQLRGVKCKMAIASSAPLENIYAITHCLGIRDSFDAIVSAEDVREGKPSPQAFLLAAKRLGVPSDRCVVIEDAVAGVQAAKAAGMQCIAVTNTHGGDKLAQADLVVRSLEEVSVDTILLMINKSQST